MKTLKISVVTSFKCIKDLYMLMYVFKIIYVLLFLLWMNIFSNYNLRFPNLLILLLIIINWLLSNRFFLLRIRFYKFCIYYWKAWTIRKIRAPTKIVCEIVLHKNSSKIYNRGTYVWNIANIFKVCIRSFWTKRFIKHI